MPLIEQQSNSKKYKNLMNQNRSDSEMKLRLSEAFVAFCVKPLGPKPKDILSD